MEHQTLGRRFICPIGPATEREFILEWRISRIGNLILILHNLVCYHAKEDTIRHTHTVYKECHIFGWNSWRHSCIALRCVLIQSCPLTIYCIVASRNMSRLVTCLSNWCDLAPSVLDNKNVFYELYYNMYHVLNWNKRLQIK